MSRKHGTIPACALRAAVNVSVHDVMTDDFGTGYASLRRLNRLPLTEGPMRAGELVDWLHRRQDAAQ